MDLTACTVVQNGAQHLGQVAVRIYADDRQQLAVGAKAQILQHRDRQIHI